MTTAVHQGRCLCGAVRFELRGPARPVVFCHCGQCLRTHGHHAAYTAVDREALVLVEQRGLKWYRSSEYADRGFCQECGASLFWKPCGKNYIAVSAGTLDQPSGLRAVAHIFVADKPDYYEIRDQLQTFSGSAKGRIPGVATAGDAES